MPTAAEDLWREFDECVRIESPERADDHCGGGDRHEPVAEREGILLVVGAVSWNQDQRRKNTEPSKPASSEPGLDDSENGGAGRGKDRFVVGPLLPAQESALGSAKSDYRHGAQVGLRDLSYAQVPR